MLKGVGPAALRKIAAIPDIDVLPIDEIARKIPAVEKSLQEQTAWERAERDADLQIDEAGRYDARILSPLDSEYPSLLSATRDDPFLIFVRGRLHSNPEKSVAIIGTREPTPHGVLIAQRITKFFVDAGWSVVSGLAIGCDAIAHQTAIEARGHTVAVLAHGLQTIAPTRHKKLAEEILDTGGALISEYRFGQSAQPQQFVKRDRTQAGLARGVVMIQSDIKGGSLHASRAALDYQRWLAVPYPTTSDRANIEPKIQANLLLAEGNVEEKAELLRCPPSVLRNLIILKGKEDYSRMINGFADSKLPVMPAQTSFI